MATSTELSEIRTLDLLRRVRGPLREPPHLGGDDRKAAAGVAGPRRLDTGVQGQQIGLEGNVVDNADDGADFLRQLLDALDSLDGLLHGCHALDGIDLRRRNDVLRPGRGVRRLVDRADQFLNGGTRLLEHRRLALSAFGELVRGGGNFARLSMDRSGDKPDIGQRRFEVIHGQIIVRLDGAEGFGQIGKTESQVALLQAVEALADRGNDLGELDGGVALGFLDRLLLHFYRTIDGFGGDAKRALHSAQHDPAIVDILTDGLQAARRFTDKGIAAIDHIVHLVLSLAENPFFGNPDDSGLEVAFGYFSAYRANSFYGGKFGTCLRRGPHRRL